MNRLKSGNKSQAKKLKESNMRLGIFIFSIFIIHSINAQWLPMTPWKERGPINFPINASGQINGIGRICQVKFHMTDTATMYAASASGGLYKTTNGGSTWTNLMGSIYITKGSQASVCVDYQYDNIIYLGTGDANYYSSGTGVWKSTDGGQNFVLKNTGMGNRLVVEMLQHPSNRAIILAATNNGIYKTTDSANNWTLKTASALRFTDMEYKPGTNGRVIYAVTRDSGYYRSTDFGETWINLMNTGGLSIPSGGSSNGMRIAVCESDTNVLYLAMVKNYGTIFKSNDGGTTFTTMKNASMPNLTGYSNTAGDAGQGNYNFDINCDPANPSVLYLVAHNVWKSTDSGINWTQKTNWWAVVHTDMHQMAISPHNASKVYNVNDGGVWLTQDGANSWVQKSDGLAADEISPSASSNIDYNCVSIGTQDNGELYREDTNTWKTNRGGDFYEKMNYDYVNPRTVYYFNGFRRLVTGSQTSLNFPFSGSASLLEFNKLAKSSCIVGKGDSLWISKNILSSAPTWSFVGKFAGNNLKDIAWSINDTNKLYTINNNSLVYFTNNLYATTPSFTSSATPSTTNTAASIALINKKDSTLYISCGNIIYKSTNAGTSWTNIKYNFPNINIINLYHDPFTTNESIYAVGSIAVYFKMDTMTSWQNMVQNLPTISSIVSVVPFNNGAINSEMRVTYFGKGMWSIPIETKKLPSVDFKANYTKLCNLGKFVQFTDSTVNNPTSWNWSFPGGIPSTSTAQHPIVRYDTAGIYSVTLTASNAVGSNALTKTAYITVVKGDTLPMSHNFETITLPTNWSIYDDGNDGRKWKINDTISAFGVGSKSYSFDNTAYMSTSKKDAIITSVLNLNTYDSVWVSFDRAFAISYWSQWYGDSKDTLELAVDNTCGTGTFNTAWIKGHTSLATGAPTQADGAKFVPTSTQWKKDTVNLTAYAGQKEVSLLFRIKKVLSGGYGQIIYLDNIKIWGKPVVVKDTTWAASICEGQSYTFGSRTITTTGIYKDTIRKVNTGADSIRRNLNIKVNLPSSATINKSICQGESFLFNGLGRTATGTYLDTLINYTGCDSFLTLQLTVKNVPTYSYNVSICQGESYMFNGSNRTATGVYKDTLVSYNGCDSFMTLNLTVHNTSQTTVNKSFCQGQGYLFRGVWRTSSGTFLDTLKNVDGCDSFVTLILNVNPLQGTINKTICQGQSYYFNGMNRITSGTYYDTLTNTQGCDSILTLYLTVSSPILTTLNQSICQGQTYLFNGMNQSTTGTYRDTFTSINGCDSIIVLYLKVISAPKPFILGNTVLCDSVLLTIYSNFKTYQWSNGKSTKATTVFTGGKYFCTVSDTNGCFGKDSIVVLDGRIMTNPTISSVKNVMCNNESISLNATTGFNNYKWSTGFNSSSNILTINTSGNYTVTVTNVYGCKAVAQKEIFKAPVNILNLQLLPSYCVKDTVVNINASSTIPCLSKVSSFNGVHTTFFKPNNYTPQKYSVAYSCTDTNQCVTTVTKEITIVNCNNVAISNLNPLNIKIYPNPANEMIHIELGEHNASSVHIHNALGQRVWSQENHIPSKLTINTSAWAEGVYFIEIRSKDNESLLQSEIKIERR